MRLTGGCYCGKLRYEVTGEPVLKGQCHCRECQYVSGGGPNYFLVVAAEGVAYVDGVPKTFARSDLETPVTREFCAECGTHILTRRDEGARAVVKIGTLDEPRQFGGPQMAIFTIDKQPFHLVPEGLPTFERLPQR